MAREIVVSNGRLAVALDSKMQVKDLYYPMVGLENHLAGHAISLGVWVNGSFSWVGDGWQISMKYLAETMVSECLARHEALGIELEVNDAVHFYRDIYLRKIVVRNLSSSPREVRLFQSHDFHIYGSDAGDTALYFPDLSSILHYKGQRYFLIGGLTGEGMGIYQFATGYKGRANFVGTWKDAEDGVLSGNPISQGAVDSVISFSLNLKPESEGIVYCWIACGKNTEAIEELHDIVKEIGVEQLLLETENYWSAWVNKRSRDLSLLPRDIAKMFKTSLVIMRSHVDNSGAIVASIDSDVLQFNRDTYAYVWPRDGAIAALAFDMAGFDEISRLFFQFCNRVLAKKGFFYHKYSPDGSQGSSWHALVDQKGRTQLPIQEDETGLVLYALWNHFQRCRDIEFVTKVYSNLVMKTTDFLLSYIDQSTGLPKPSFDIWEERYGVFTATVATICSALSSAAKFAKVFYDNQRQQILQKAATRMRQAMLEHLFDKDSQRFIKAIYPDGYRDRGADSSLSFLFNYGPFSATENSVVATMKHLRDKLWVKTQVGGMARYENDEYYRISGETQGNPWFLCTLWLARWYIAAASSLEELNKGLELLSWGVNHGLKSGILGEQINPFSGQLTTVSPLIWSHAEFVIATCEYLDRYQSILSAIEVKKEART